jgi:pyruvate dehydrogenase E1 component beta subunit
MNPVLIMEHKLLYGSSSPGGTAVSAVGEFAAWMTPAPEDDYDIPFGKADVKRNGEDLTIVATSVMALRALQIAEQWQKSENVSIEVIDPRTIVPLDIDTICQSVSKTHRCLVLAEVLQEYPQKSQLRYRNRHLTT